MFDTGKDVRKRLMAEAKEVADPSNPEELRQGSDDEREKKWQLSTEVAVIVKQIDALILSLTDEHLEHIAETVEAIQRDMFRYEALGIMFEPETSGPRRKLAKQSIDRLRAMLLWWECIAIMDKAQVEALSARVNMEAFKKQIGL